MSAKVAPRLDVTSLSKTFGPVQVLHDVNLCVQAGEVHGLAGQNGSGKSTLIKILTGVHPPDHGATYRVDGRPMHLPVRWPEVHSAGISVVHQDLGLLDQLSVAENICVGGFPTKFGRIVRNERNRLAARTLDRLGVDLDLDRLVGTLTAAERAEIAIARALRDHQPGGGLVILDESTRALTGVDLERVHTLVRRITAQGGSLLLISHNLTELMSVTDRLTVLRDGRVVEAGALTASLSEQDIARRMLGGTLTHVEARMQRPEATSRPQPVLTVTAMTGRRVSDITFEVGRGEVLGITGLPGSGYEDIPYLLGGIQRATGGQLTVDDKSVDLTRAKVRDLMKMGVALVPERRDRDGLAFDLNVRDNLSLPELSRQGKPWHVARRWQHDRAQAAIDAFGIQPPAPETLVKQLSGGNQQKVLLAKWLGIDPTVLLLHEPTQAVDVGARQDILGVLRQAADSTVAIVMVSSEPEDLIAACDRVLIYTPGTGLRPALTTTVDNLIELVYGRTTTHAGSEQ